MEVVILENNETIKTINVEAPKNIADMIQSLEDFRQKVNVFLTEKIEEKGGLEEYEESGSSSDNDEEDVKVPVSPKKRKKLP